MNDKIIKIDDVEGKVYELDNWKPEQATQVKNHFTERFKELKEAYDKLINYHKVNLIILNDIKFNDKRDHVFGNKAICFVFISLYTFICLFDSVPILKFTLT